jgi:plasmid replication initiation protein
MPRASIRSPWMSALRPKQIELFVATQLDVVSLRDDIDIMSLPFFSIEKTPRHDPIEFERTVGDRRQYIRVSPGEFGLATIWDNDIILYLRTQIIEALNRDREVSKKISFHIHDCLVATGRRTGGREYELFKEALTRLKTTTVLTNISTTEEIADEGFGWLESFKIKRRRTAGGAEVMASCEVVVSDWLFGLFVNSRRALAIDSAYFDLQGGLERKLYGILRKHLGQQSMWQIGLDTLKDLCGVRRDVRRFTYDLKKIVERGLPGFELEITKTPRGARIVSIDRTSKRAYLVVRPAARTPLIEGAARIL